MNNDLIQELRTLDEESTAAFTKMVEAFEKKDNDGQRNEMYVECIEHFYNLSSLTKFFDYIYSSSIFMNQYTREFETVVDSHNKRLGQANCIFYSLKFMRDSFFSDGEKYEKN
jgi:hypothetical protein